MKTILIDINSAWDLRNQVGGQAHEEATNYSQGRKLGPP